MYYVGKSHPATIDKETLEVVQLEMERRRDYMGKHGVRKLDFINVEDNC